MSLVVVGINHRTAPVEVRERVVFEPARIPDALQRAADLAGRARVGHRFDVQPDRTVLRDGYAPARARHLAAALPRPRRVDPPLPVSPRRRTRPSRMRTAVASGLDSMVHRRAADPRPAEGRLPRRAGNRHDGTGAEPPVPVGVLGRQARAHRNQDRRQRGFGRVGGGGHGAARSLRVSKIARRCMVGAGETVALAARHLLCRRPAPHDHRQPQRRPRARTGRGVPRLRDRPRRNPEPPARKPTSSSPPPRRRPRSSRAR